ncbi:MAG TPA: sodium:proton antiporter [Pirellulaceae bacterium]|nr:sodium:proton antiporter [Pirellulaceae bacterium]
MESLRVEQLELIILVGAMVAILARRLKFAYTAGLVVAGVVIAFLPIAFDIPFSKELVFDILLPPLIFEAALYIDWKELRKDLVPIAAFATLGVVLSAVVTAVVMHYAAGWVWPAAAIFGVLIAATDPVSIIATFKEAKVEGRLRLLVEAESLFNDATAAVAFFVVVAVVSGAPVGGGIVAWKLISSSVGGVLCGLVVGGGVLLIIGRTRDHLVELSMTTLAAFGSFWLAEHFGLSGILATTTAGLLIGNLTAFGPITEKGGQSIESFWEFAAFVANSVIFVILGINLASQDFAAASFAIGVAIIAVMAGRALAVYPVSAMFTGSALRIEVKQQHVLFWGGLRGALALALALGVPETRPYRQEILTVTFGVVAFSVFVQGLTMRPLLRRFGLVPK